MKYIEMITAALAGTVADWDYNWGSLSSSFFQNNKNTKTTKNMFASLQFEIAEMLTAPPSIFVPGHTVLDSSIPFIHVDAVPLFDISSTIVSSFEYLRGVSFESIRQQVVPHAHQVVRHVQQAMRKVQQLKVKTGELVAAQVKNWKEFIAAKTMMLRRWIIAFLKNNTTILPRYVWNLVTVTETIWHWRFFFEALTLIYRLSAVSTGWWAALFLFPQALLATLRAFDVPHKLFVATFPQLAAAYRLLKMIYGCYKAYRFLRTCWNAVRNLRRIQIHRSVADTLRALVSWALRQIAAVLWNTLREALLGVATIMLIPVLLYVLFH
jgi:hypothetical protein